MDDGTGAHHFSAGGGFVAPALTGSQVESHSLWIHAGAVDADGIKSLKRRAEWTSSDALGRRLDIYGSGGWGFESLRACHSNSAKAARLGASAGIHRSKAWAGAFKMW
jgi:hypothetical protein